MKNIISFILDFRDNMSGIELASSMRSLILQDIIGCDHTYFTSIYNRKLSYNVQLSKEIGRISKNAKYINIYDHYQDASMYENKNDYSIVDKFSNYKLDKMPGCNDYRVYDSRGNFKFFIKNFDFIDGIDFINYLDSDGVVVRTDYYDVRKFLSMTHIYFNKINDKTWLQLYYRPDGIVSIIKQMQYVDNKYILNIKLFDRNGFIVNEYDNEEDFIYDYINYIISKDQYDEYIIDRCKEFYPHIVKSLDSNKIDKKPVVIVHNAHAGLVATDGITSHFYQSALEGSRIKTLVALTNRQKSDIEKRYSNSNTIFIPNFYDPKSIEPVIRDNTIVYLARYAEEKQHLLALDIFKIVNDRYKDVVLEFYGFGILKDKIIEYIKELNLSAYVKVFDFAFDISSIYNKARMSILTSRVEGFCMSLNESLAYGCPAVAFDINYGPDEIIIDSQNGFLIKPFDKIAFADKIIDIMKDDELHKNLSNNAKNLSGRFSSVSVATLWSDYLNGE